MNDELILWDMDVLSDAVTFISYLDLLFFSHTGVLPAEVAQNISARAADLCRDLTPQALSLTDAFAMNNEMLSAPIARDWVKYNVGDNQGELACDY